MAIAIAVLRFVPDTAITRLFVKSEALIVNDWTDYGPEARRIYINNIGVDFPDLSMAARESYGDCVVGKVIPIYNASGCPYSYNSITGDEATHLEQQEQCLEDTQTLSKLGKVEFNCLAESLGESWALDRERTFRHVRDERGLDDPEIKPIVRDTIAYCVADGLAPLLDTSGCSPFEGYSIRDGYSESPCYNAFVAKMSTRRAADKIWAHCTDPDTYAK